MFKKDYCKAIYDIAELVPIKELAKAIDEISAHIQNGGNRGDKFCRDKYFYLLKLSKTIYK